MAKVLKFRLETCFVFFLLVLGIVIAIVSLRYGFGSLGRPGPGLYPFFIGTAIAVFALFLMISKLRSGAPQTVLGRREASTLVLMILTFCLWIIAMPLLGYVIVTFLAAYAFCEILRLERWWKPLAVAGGTALFIYLLFDYWLYIDLPRGILG